MAFRLCIVQYVITWCKKIYIIGCTFMFSMLLDVHAITHKHTCSHRSIREYCIRLLMLCLL